MILSPEKIAELKVAIRKHMEGYPDVSALLASGKLSKKSGYYIASNKATWDACAPYMPAVLVTKSREGRFKLHRRPSEKMRRDAARLK